MKAFALVLVVALAGCVTLPPPGERTPTHALPDTSGTLIGRAMATRVGAHAGSTAVHPLPNPLDAFAARALLAAVAEASIDAQYYVWHADRVGDLLFEALWRSAERGVRVRLLLDDANTHGLDRAIVALDAHPNIEVRLYNPLVLRSTRLMNYVVEFDRANRRMHNKAFIVDNQLAIVGGRNIGDEYFAAGGALVFADLDVLAGGGAVPEVSRQFDLYWNSASAYPARTILGPPPAGAAGELERTFASNRAGPESQGYLDAVRRTSLIRDILDHRLSFEWTTVQVLYDDPAKTLEPVPEPDVLLFPRLVKAMGRPRRTLDLVSPYLVPGDAGTAALAALVKEGVSVRILTNSLASTDEKVVHSGYARHRRDLLEAGVRLFELKPTAVLEDRERSGTASSGTSGLHAKTFAVDGERIFIGSFNFDQRSNLINTEMGFVIESATLAGRLAQAFDERVPARAYEVRLAPGGGGLEWIERTAAGEVRHVVEPGTTLFQRSAVRFMSLLPIEWLL